jgi:hypothetical protein
VRTQFNLATQRGREAYEDAKFFGGDQEWSIGFSIPTGKSKVNKNGVRDIFEVELFEYSQVLFGAMPLTATVGVKAAQVAYRDLAKDAGVALHEFRGDGEACEACGQPDGTKGHVTPPEEEPLREGEEPVQDDSTEEAANQPEPVPDPPNVADQGEDADDPVMVRAAALYAELLPQFMRAEDGDDGEQKVVLDSAALDAEVARRLADPDAKAFALVDGCYEERQVALNRAVRQWLHGPDADGFFEDDRRYRYYSWCEATFDARVVWVVEDWNGDAAARYFEASYTFAGGEAELGDVREVALEVSVVAKARDWRAAASFLRQAEPIDEKAGRVLSRKNATTVLGAVDALVKVLDAAGVEHPYGKAGEKAAEEANDPDDVDPRDVEVPEGKALITPDELLRVEALLAVAG